MSILLFHKTSEVDRIQGEPFRMDPALIDSGDIPAIRWYEWRWSGMMWGLYYRGAEYPFWWQYNKLQAGWSENADGYTAPGPYFEGCSIYGFRHVNFDAAVDFSFDAFVKSAMWIYEPHTAASEYQPCGNVFDFRIYDCDTGERVFSHIIGGYSQETITCTIPAGRHCLVFEYAREFIIESTFGNNRPEYTDLTDDWHPVPSGETADNTVTLSNFTPILEASIAVYCPAVGEAEDTATQPEIDISAFEPTSFEGIIEALTGDIITMASPSGMSELVFHTLDDVEQIEISAYAVGNDWTIPVEKAPFLKTVYVCILTGAEDGLDDYELPCSSLSATRRNGEPSYLSVVIPNITAHQAAISARPNGDIEIYKGFEHPDGTRNLERILDVNFSHLLFSKGARSQSGSAVGYRQKTYSNPVERSLSGVFFHGMSQDGTTTLKSDVDLFVSPGDTCVYGDTEFTIDFVRYTINPRLAYMEVVE